MAESINGKQMLTPIEGQELEVTPLGNTGSDSLDNYTIETGIDWLTAVGTVSSRTQVKAIVDYIAGCGSEDIVTWAENSETFDGIKYHHHVRSVQGAKIQWSLPEDLGANEGRIRITVPGQLLGQMSTRSQWRLINGLHHAYKLRATRLDVRLDVYGWSDILELVHSAVKVGHYSGALTHKIWEGFQRTDTGVLAQGKSIYLGSSQSDKLVRIYDKNAESEGDKNCIRFELQARNDLAANIMFEYAQIQSDDFEALHQKYLIGIVLGAIDFVDRGSGDRYSRQDRLPWYERLVSLAGARISLPTPKIRLFIEEKIAWAEKQVACTLAQIREVRGVEWFNKWMRNLLHIGKERLTKDHWAMIYCAKAMMQKSEPKSEPKWKKGSGLKVAH